MKGRKANAAAKQAKADPGSRPRRGAAARAIAAADQRAAAAQERARQFAPGTEAAALPAFMANDPQYAGAAAIWRHYAALLDARRLWEPEYAALFVGFCIYADEFLAADREVKANGTGVTGKSTSGGARFWRNPAVDVRDHAYARMLDLSGRFGFTPLDLYKLERESAAAASTKPRAAQPPASGELPLDPDKPVAASPAQPGGPGALSGFDSEPPQRMN